MLGSRKEGQEAPTLLLATIQEAHCVLAFYIFSLHMTVCSSDPHCTDLEMEVCVTLKRCPVRVCLDMHSTAWPHLPFIP